MKRWKKIGASFGRAESSQLNLFEENAPSDPEERLIWRLKRFAKKLPDAEESQSLQEQNVVTSNIDHKPIRSRLASRM